MDLGGKQDSGEGAVDGSQEQRGGRGGLGGI